MFIFLVFILVAWYFFKPGDSEDDVSHSENGATHSVEAPIVCGNVNTSFLLMKKLRRV